MKLTKFANWFSDRERQETLDEDPEKQQSKTQPANQSEAELFRMQSKLDKLSDNLRISQKELAQARAQLQINQGFQIELGETQLKLQQTEAELQSLKHEMFEQQKQFNAAKLELQQTKQSLTQLTESQDWFNQIKTPIEIAEIKKTLPKQEFETLWGFGIISPTAKSTITTGAILVKGWVLGKKTQAQSVIVKHEGKSILETPANLRRPIVIQQYPDIPNAGSSGFEFSLAVAGITDELELSLEALLSDETTVPLCNFLLKPQTIESNSTKYLR